ncbi:MAG: DUF4147 domain-containing protein [Thaumarchaeota archaeon]|nr:DUF4147 domain-containing protein [Nitrososphaerota archaeon]
MERAKLIAFSNSEEIVRIGERKKRELILRSFKAAVEAAQPEYLFKNRISVVNDRMLVVSGTRIRLNLRNFDKLIVVGAGKASGGMAVALESILAPSVDLVGAITVLKGTARRYSTRHIALNEARHPKPSISGVRATQKIVRLLQSATPDSLVICLISGGGSSLMCLPADEVTLHEKTKVTDLLLKSGASIEKINCVRKHLSRIKGGQLPAFANGATVLALIISDIVGNPLESIASGPTVGDPTTFSQALSILEEYGLDKIVSKKVTTRLKKGSSGLIPETPKPGSALFRSVYNVLVGDNALACKAATGELRKSVSPVYLLGSGWQGEAREIGRDLGSMMVSVVNRGLGSSFRLPCAFVWGGETTVTVRGRGVGGRNQEEAMGALESIKERKGICIGFLGNYGKDGKSNAAGAIVDYATFRSALRNKVRPEIYLENNDSHNFFRKIGGSLLNTGPTGTNVTDIGIAVVS